MKKRISVYIDEGVWELAKTEARRISVEINSDISGSEVVEDAIKAFCKVPVIKGKAVQAKTDIPSLEEKAPTKDRAVGQADLDSKREKRDIKKEKIEKVREQVTSLTGFVGGYSKDHQARGKAK
jgi:hypothetical protein